MLIERDYWDFANIVLPKSVKSRVNHRLNLVSNVLILTKKFFFWFLASLCNKYVPRNLTGSSGQSNPRGFFLLCLLEPIQNAFVFFGFRFCPQIMLKDFMIEIAAFKKPVSLTHPQIVIFYS